MRMIELKQLNYLLKDWWILARFAATSKEAFVSYLILWF